MKKNGMRFLLRAWIALTSVVVFVGGWIFVGHAGKPVDVSGADVTPLVEPLPTLEPLPSIGEGSSIQPLQRQQPSFQFAQPQFRTRGS